MAKGSAINEASLGAIAGGGHGEAESEAAKGVLFVSDVKGRGALGVVSKADYESGMLQKIQNAIAPGTKLSDPVISNSNKKFSMDDFKKKNKD